MDGSINCASCGGIAIQSSTTEVISLKNCKIIIDNAPCYTCTICGETMYFDDVAEQFEKIVRILNNDLGGITYLDYNTTLQKHEMLKIPD